MQMAPDLTSAASAPGRVPGAGRCRGSARGAACAFHGLRLLDLDDHLGARKDLGGIGHQLAPAATVLRIGQVDRGAGIGLHQHLVAMGRELAHAGRRQADTVFVVLDFLGHADEHVLIIQRIHKPF
jgi:hypothetical protein